MSPNVDTVEPPNPETSPEPQPQQLSQFLPDGGYGHNPVVRLCGDGREVVVMGRSDAVSVEACHAEQLSTYPAHLTAVAVDDPARQTHLLRQALKAETRQRTHTTTELQAAASTLQQTRQEHQRVMAEIRSYAIDAYRRNDICFDGLSRFLERFEMDDYEPHLRVSFTITGSVDISSEDESRVRSDVENYLDLDLSQVDDVGQDRITFDTTVTDVDHVD